MVSYMHRKWNSYGPMFYVYTYYNGSMYLIEPWMPLEWVGKGRKLGDITHHE
jgi:hypothetical protein